MEETITVEIPVSIARRFRTPVLSLGKLDRLNKIIRDALERHEDAQAGTECPTCCSRDPKRYPVSLTSGEVRACKDPFHQHEQATAGSGRFIDIVFDGPPSHESGRFVEVEDEAGRSIRVGT